MDESIIKSLFRWFADCEVLEVDNDLNVDYLGDDPEQYSIEVVPCKTVLKQYVDGSAKCQYLFVFASRENYSPDESINMANLEFYERLQEMDCRAGLERQTAQTARRFNTVIRKSVIIGLCD